MTQHPLADRELIKEAALRMIAKSLDALDAANAALLELAVINSSCRKVIEKSKMALHNLRNFRRKRAS